MFLRALPIPAVLSSLKEKQCEVLCLWQPGDPAEHSVENLLEVTSDRSGLGLLVF